MCPAVPPGGNLATDEDSGSSPVSLEVRSAGGIWDPAGTSHLDVNRVKACTVIIAEGGHFWF